MMSEAAGPMTAAMVREQVLEQHGLLRKFLQDALAAGVSLKARQIAYDVQYRAAQGTLWDVFWLAVALAFGLAVTHYLMFYVSRTLQARIFVDLQNRMADHMLGLSVRYFGARTARSWPPPTTPTSRPPTPRAGPSWSAASRCRSARARAKSS